MNNPHVFHGTRQDVTVPADSSALDSDLGCSPNLRYAGAYILPGTRIEIYCSGITIFDNMHVNSVVPISPAAVLILLVTASIITASCPDSSIIPPNIIAITVIRIEEDMFISPPVVSKSFKADTSVLQTNPFFALTKISPKVTPT